MTTGPTSDPSPPIQENVAGSSLDPVEARPAKKKVNPLVDLIETEQTYVELLAVIIRRVASAWSRSNFPPSQLDTMFRAVETIYRTNRGLLSVGFQVRTIVINLSTYIPGRLETERYWAESKLPQGTG